MPDVVPAAIMICCWNSLGAREMTSVVTGSKPCGNRREPL